MLLCNETIAQHIFWQEIPFMYRVHEDPDIEKMLDFNELIQNFGYKLKGIRRASIQRYSRACYWI